jgi:hypothetical protein
VPEAAPPPPPPDEAAPQKAAQDAAVARDEKPPPQVVPVEEKQVSPRARLNYDSEREEVYVEVLDRKTGEVLFTFPAKESESARLIGLGQGSLVDQYA